jgi:hypothetical protein
MKIWRLIERIFFVATLAVCIYWIVKLNRDLAAERETNVNEKSEFDKIIDGYRHTQDSIGEVNKKMYLEIDALDTKFDSLEKVKQKVQIRYERDKSDLQNPAIVGNDSISRYIRSAINAGGK